MYLRQPMLSVDEALNLVLDSARPLAPIRTNLAGPLGCALARSVVSDLDSPPHDKAIVDGYAVMTADTTRPGVELMTLEEVVAGTVPTKPVVPGTATRIMTGAPLPQGANA